MFSLQYRKAKTVWENVYIYNFILLGILYWQMLCQYVSLYANCDMQYVMFQTQCILLLRLMLLQGEHFLPDLRKLTTVSESLSSS